MSNTEIKKSRNEQIAELLASGERIKDFYRFTAQNPHIDLHDACQIVLARPKASICFYMDEWNEMGRRVTRNRKGIQFYDTDGNKQYVFDLHDTHGDKRYRRLIFPMRCLLYGLDELNGTEIAESNRRDYSKVLSGVAQYLDDNGDFTADEQRNNLIAEGVAYSLYSKTGFPKDGNITLRGMPYDLDENARLFKEVYLLTELAKEDISAAYERRINTPQIIDDIEEETVSDEPTLTEKPAQEESSDSAEPAGTEEEIPEPEEEEPESQEVTAPAANPLYERYMAAQREKPNAAVLIRVGDFYEVFGERAKEVAEWLDITLTSRDVGLPERIPMCGFPCYAADLYIQKILEHRGMAVLEPDAEPIYIRPHEAPRAGEAEQQPIEEHEPKTEAEAEFTFEAAELDELNELLSEELSTSAETPTAAKQPEISGVGEVSGEEQAVSEPSEPEEEEYTEDEEPEEDEEEYESDEEEDRETRSGEKKDSKVKGKEKSIRERKKKEKPQMSLFDLLDGEKEPSREERLIERQLLRGSGIEDGKYRIYEKYFTDPTVKEYAKFLKDEYGIGGYGYGQERQDHNGKGIRMEWQDREHPENSIRIDLKWDEVAVRIADLIDEDKYLTVKEKEDYEKRYKPKQAEQRRQREAEQKQKDEFVFLVIQNTNPVRKQRILDEYGKTTKIVEFAEFLKNEYGYSTEATSEYLARYDANGVWLSKYDRNGNTELRDYLSWNDFAGKVCDLIEDDRLFSDDNEERLNRIADSMIETGIEHTGDGNYSYFFGTFGQDERFVKEHYEELSEALRKRTEVKDVYRDDWYIHVTYYKDYCVELRGSDAAKREHEDRVRAIAAQIVEEGTENTTEGNWAVYFNELTGDEEFAKTNAQEIAEELGRHESVADVEFDNACFNTAFYLDHCPNYIPKDGEDENGAEPEAAEEASAETKLTERQPKRFTELTAADKAFYERFIQTPYRAPIESPWGAVQDCTEIAPGIYSVVTAGHGGIMIDRALAPHILSTEALAEGFVENGCYCYEEDAAASIPLRELYDKGILHKTNEYFTRLEYVSTDPDAEDEYIRFSDLPEMEQERKLQQWNDAVNETVAHWYPKYWEAYQQALQTSLKAKNTDLNAVLDQSELGGAKSRFKGNTDAIRLMNRLYFENREATDEERKVLAKYVGWGGLAQAFDETNEQWSKEYAELKDLLTTEQYEKAKGSVLNAHYTSKEVIGGIYAALERFGVKGGNRILEPAMGTGNFFGYMPQEISDDAKLYGVELDEVTGKIAAKLYPQAKVQIKGFEETSFPQDYFDVVVGNVPFGGYGVYDSEYSRQKFMIHDYFIAKSIDRVKPNGIVAVVTSKGTLDKLNPVARKYMAERAELLGAIRLPNTAFKQTANTEAVTDILFFQKRSEKIIDTSDIEWLGTGKTEDGFEVNNYFIAHPEMVIGTFAKETGLYGAEGLTVKPDGRNLGEAIAAAIETLPQNIYENPKHSPADAEGRESADVFDIRPMCYTAVNGKLYMRVGEELVKQELPSTPKDAYERVAGMIDLRNELRHVLDIQSEGCTDEVLNRAQRKLNADYDRFVRKYGYINSQTNTRLFREDGDAALLFACEVLSEDKTKATKADVFTKRTIRPYSVPAHTSDTLEAMQICRNERGGVDIAYIEELTGKDFDTVLSELGDTVYRDPTMVKEGDKYSGYQTAEEYLSGKVVEKLRIARYFAAEDTAYARNVAALEKVQPEPLKADEISVRIGASWVKPEYYKQFLMELLDIYRFYKDGLQVRYNAFDSSWKVERAEHVRKNAGMNATEKYGTSRANAFRLFEDCLNQRATTIHDTVLEDGREKQVLNQAETIAAREKQNKIKEAFADWIYADPKRREELEETYNSLFNQIRLPSYDGSYLKFPGMNPAIELRPHQKNAVARIAGMGNSTLLHHVVGSGKSFTMAASAMKLRQYGLAKKPMIVVPNHLVQQMANEFRTLYPTAKILVAGKEDLEKNKRKQFVSKVAMGDWDSVIIAQSSFAKIPVSRARQERMMREEIAKIEAAINEMEEKTGARVAVKNLERIKKGREAMLKKLLDSGKKDDVLIFENLGVDYLFVDEADAYKNRFLYTKMNNVSGISNAASARASDMQLKIEYINELHGGDKGVVFATGTPISNSMAEMYIMQSYLQKNTLEELGINYFDGWAADFGETVTALEMAPSGQGYRARTRFAKFTNLPELMTLYRSFADVQTADMVKLDVPEAERITVTLEPNEQTVQIAEEIAKRAEAIYGGSVDPHEDNMLKVTSDGKKLALDVRCFDPFLKDEGSGKLDECADNAAKVYEETNALRGTQLIFCDLSTPKKPYENYEYGKDFDVYNDLKHKLIERGIPAEEIAFIHDAKTDKEKQTLFDKMNEGRIRILIGSTEKCGAGTNVQKRLAALHHLDAPYRPRDLQQRDGRGIRQHNMNKSVKIFTYVTKRTLDSYCYQILENKQRFISQIENGSLTVREAEDIDETTLSYAEIKAITAANPKIKRKVELETELTRLRVLEGQYRKNLYALQDKTIKDLPSQIRTQEQLLKYAQEDEANMREKYNPDVFSINVLGKVYTDKKEGAAALLEALRSNKYDTPVAEYGGFRISLNSPSALGDTRSVALTHHGSYGMEFGDSELGLITRLDNFMRDFPERKGRFSAKLELLKRDLAVAEAELKKPFEHKGKIEEIMKELSEINAELDLNKREEVVIDTEEESDDEEVNYMALPERETEKTEPAKRPHKRMTEKLYALYTDYKAKYPDAVIFLKNGDFYETVGGEAKIAADTYGAATYEKELGGEKRIVAMLTYENLDAMVKELSEENRQFKILEPEKEIGRDTDFLEMEEEAKAIAENEKEPEVAAEEEDKVYYSVVPEDEKYILYMIDDSCRVNPVGELYATADEAREAAQTFGDEPQNCERVEVSLDELQEYASNAGDEAKIQVPILPDYYITQEEMHEYGYLWNGVLPLTKPAMRNNFQNCLLLYEDDTEGYIAGESDIEEHDGLFGIECSDWKRFIESENGKAYLAARLFASTAVMKMVGEDYSETDEREADGHNEFTSRLKEENVALSNYFKDKWFPLPEAMQPYAENIIAEYAERIEGVYRTEARGKTSAEIKSEIIARIGMPEILSKQNRAAAKEVVFNENREYLEQHGEVPCYVIEHNEKTGKYRYRTIGGYEIFVPSQAYDDARTCRAAAPRGVELADMEELAEISRMRCKIYPDYFMSVSENGQYYPLSRRKAQQLFNLGLPVCYAGGDAEYVPITEQSTLDNTEKDFFIGRAEWYAFTRTDEGKAYLYARLLTVKATKEVVEKDLDTVGYYTDSYAEAFYAERNDLENFFNGQPVPSDESVKPYLYGLCREYASRIDGNGNLSEYGWWYEDIIKAIAKNLPEQFSGEVKETAKAETEALKPDKTYYSVVEKDGEWRLCGIDNYDTKVTYIKFRTEEKKDKYINDMLSANSDLRFEEVPYEKLEEIANEMKAKREAYIARDREVFLEKQTEEEKSKETSDASVALLPDYTLREDGSMSVENLKDGMYKVRRETAEVLRGLLPVYNIEPDGSERRIGTEENLLMGSWKLGVKAQEWKEFLESDKSLPYLSTRYLVTDAAYSTVHYDANSGEVTKKPFSVGADAILRTELRELYAVMEERGTSPVGKMQPYVDGIMAEYMYRFVINTPYVKENQAWNNHGEAFRWEIVRRLRSEDTREAQYEKLMSDMKSIADYLPDNFAFYTPVWDDEEKKYYIYTASGYNELKKGAAGYETIGECRRSLENGIELPHMQALMPELQEYYKKRLEEYREMLSSDPQVFKDVAVKETSVRPDYWISGEEMHEYGYARKDMLPLRERAARYLAEQFSLPVYKLYQNNAAEQATNAGDIDAFGGIFGVKKEDWGRFLKTDKAKAYFGASLVAVTAAQKALNNDMDNVDARFTGVVSDKLFLQNNEISRYLSREEQPGTKAMKPYIRQAVQKYAYWLNAKIPFDYGWDADSIEAAMLNYVEPAELKSYLNQSGGAIRYYGKDTENTAYAYVSGELNAESFAKIAEQGNGADTFVIAAGSTAWDTQALQSRSIFYLETGKEIQEADLSNEDTVIGKMQTVLDKLTAERARESMDLYQRIRDSVLEEYADYEKTADEELPYKHRFYKSVAEYFEKGGANLLDENDMKALEKDKGNILARLYDYDWDGVAHDLSDGAEITVLIEYYNENKVSENAGTEDKDCAAIVRERVTRLYEQYKREHPDYANNLSRNLFYRKMHEYLQDTDTLPYAYFIALEKDGDEVLARLCEFYEQNGDLGLHTYRERQEIIEQYTKKYYPEVLHEAEKPKYFGKGADGAAYYFLPGGLSENTLSDITEKANEYVIAAPKCMLSEEELEKEHINFVKTGRDIRDTAVYGTAETAKRIMRRAAEKIKRDDEYRDTVADNAKRALEDLQDDPTVERAGHKERFFGAFAEFMAESDTFLEAGDYAELIKDGDAIMERVYAYYMGMNEQIDFEDWEELSQITKDYIDERWKMQKAMTEGVPLYGGTFEYAKANGEENLYRQSLQANIECKYEIEQAIRNNFDGMHLNKGFENKLIEQFGMARVKYVLANTVQENGWDGRYSPETKEWAKSVTVTEKNEHRSQFAVGTHPAVLDGFINRMRKAEKAYKERNEAAAEQAPKEKVYYSYLYEKSPDGTGGYRAYILDENSGMLVSVFQNPMETLEQVSQAMEKEMLGYTSKFNEYVKVEPPELLRMSNQILREKEKGEKVQEERYRTETKKGLPVVHIEKDKYGHDIAIVKRKDDFVVAIGYDVNDGTWAQGRYDFPTQDAAQKYIDKNYKPQEEEKGKWLTAKVSKDALIRRYEKHSFFRMPNGEYEEYTYNVFNNRVKDSRQLVDLQSDGHELCYELVFPADGEITIKTRDGDEVIFPAEEFIEIIGGTTNADYERKDREDDTDWYAISVPQEAHRGTYERSSLFSMPSKSEYAGYSYYIPNVFVEEDKRGEDGNILITLPESFHVTLRNRTTDDEIVVTPFDLYTECNGTQGEDYARKQSETEDVAEKKKQVYVTIPSAAKIAEYKTQTLFKMPHTGEYDGYCFYLFNDQLSQGDEGIRAKLSENFTVRLKDKKNDRQATLTAEQFKAIMDEASAEDFDSGLKKPSEEKEDLFKGAEEQLRKNIPAEMLARPNWVAVKVFRDKKKDKLVKLPKDAKTGEAASPLDPSTWSDFDTACKFAHENGCASLAYALDGKDNICCIDIDHCFNAKREMSDIAKMAWNACGNTYREVSVSREGLHIFGKTKGMGLQVFSDAGDMEFYERGKFMTVTGDAFGEGRKNLLNLDELPVRDLLSRKFSKHKTYSWAGKGIKGLSSMPDREVLERAFASKDGETFKALFNGEDLKNNHSNSDMALMRRLAFWCNGDIDQMLRIFAASGLYRPDKSPEYYEYSALKVLKDQSSYYHQKQGDSKPRQEKKSVGNSK